MNSLIKNELIKIFKKKGIYITLFIVLAFVILTNCIYKYFYNTGSYSFYNENYIENLKKELSTLDPSKPSDTSMYIDLKTEIDIFELMKKYDKNAWQRDIISSKVANYLKEKNTYLYIKDKDEIKSNEIDNKIKEILLKLEKDDWKYFAQEELKRAEDNIKELQKQKEETIDKQQIQSLQASIEIAQIDLVIAQYRINQDIKYGNDYMNRALSRYQEESKNIQQLENNKDNLKFEEKKQYNDSIAQKEINKYILDNKVDVNKTDDLRGILSSFFNEYGLFIIVMVIMIAGTIVSEEFNKGTIKLLLIKPYSRNKILLSKFITVFIMIAFSLIAILGMELIVGGIIFGFESLSIPIIEYNFNTNTLDTINVFVYLFTSVVEKLPIIILLATLSFAFSTIFTNSAVAIALPLLGYMGSDIINLLATKFNVQFLKFFVTLNWDFSQYAYGQLPLMEGLTIQFSSIICFIYFLVMIVTTFIIFKKKNIKNI